MDYIIYIGKFLYRVRWWLILGTVAITILAILFTKGLTKKYQVDCTVYTGVISGYSIEGDGTKDYAVAQNAIDNLINIIKSEGTLQKVCLRLYARCLINGNPDRDNNFISASNYRMIYNHLKGSPQGTRIISMVDKHSEDATVARLTQFFNSDKDNYLYGLFHYSMPHFCYKDLQNIKVEREGASDLLHLTYTDSDPGIAYNTLLILSTEFVNEYRTIRYGETDKVIEYFKQQLDTTGRALHVQENDLTDYNISKRVINYNDETKEIAAVNKEFELRYQDAMMNYQSSKVALKELEKQMGANEKQYLTNMEFVNKLKQVSDLQYKISQAELLGDSNSASNGNVNSYKNNLSKAQNELSGISEKYMRNQYTKQGIAKDNIVNNWLQELLTFQKSKADLDVMNRARNELNDRYVFFAPVGSTIKRKERGISFTEANYLSLLKSYDDALMRKKNLEMTSATLKVLNPPAFPLSPIGGARKKIVLAVLLGSFLFILGILLLIELLDQTLRDSIRTKRITGGKVLGAFPSKSAFRLGNYQSACRDIATRYMSSSILRFFTRKTNEATPYIVNFISTERLTGKSYLAEQLKRYWESIGLKVRVLSSPADFNTESKEYFTADSISNLCGANDANILIVEYPELSTHTIPTPLLQQANLNIVVARADQGWKANDKILFNNVKERSGEAPLYIYLNCASREEVQNYTGMLPPYTFFSRLRYRFSQFALTEHTSSYRPAVTTSAHTDDDEED
jgi:uncharacterized protein involved in exopolysaccharide biosynthesis